MTMHSVGAPAAGKIYASMARPTAVGPAVDYTALTPESLLFFCQKQLKDMDKQIAAKMEGQNTMVALQSLLTNIQGELKNNQRLEGNATDEAINDDAKVAAIAGSLTRAIEMATASGQNELVTSLKQIQFKLTAGGKDGDGKVLIGEIKDMNTMLDAAQTSCRGAAEMSMIELQSIVSKRATMLQLTTGMMNTINESAKAIAGNIGR